MEVDPEQRPEWISVRGMGGWALTKINNRPFRATNMPLPPPPNQTTSLPISRENTLQTSGRAFYGKRGAHDGDICIYNLEHINWCESRTICHIPALNQLPWNISASFNSVVFVKVMQDIFCTTLLFAHEVLPCHVNCWPYLY